MKNREIIFYERMEKLMAIIAKTMVVRCNIYASDIADQLEEVYSILEEE